jgi:glucokinase
MKKRDQKVVIGIDIGGTYTKIALVNTKGEISGYSKFKTLHDNDDRADFLDKLFIEISRAISNTENNVIGIGVSMLGLQMEDGSGTYHSANVPKFSRFNIRRPLHDRFNLPVSVTNDLTSHSLAEYYYGIGNRCDRFLNVAMGTGIGATMILKGEPVLLFGGTTGDCGRVILDPSSKIKCGGNVFGSAEALCGTKGIELLAKNYYPPGKEFVANDIIAAAREGKDEIAVKVMQEIGEYMGLLLADLSFIFFPQIIAISGGTIKAGPPFIETCKGRFNDLAGDFHRMLRVSIGEERIEIREAKLGSEAGVIGGAVPILKSYFVKYG